MYDLFLFKKKKIAKTTYNVTGDITRQNDTINCRRAEIVYK